MNLSSFRVGKLTATRIVRVGICGAILFVSQIALSFIPNCELVSFLTIIFTLSFGPEMLLSVTVFSLLEGFLYGFGLWVISYLYVWPILVILTLLFKNIFKEDLILWAVLTSMFGLVFGSLFAIAYIPVDPSYALSYWIAGLPWDVWHAITNCVVLLLLFKPINAAIKKIKRTFH